MHNDCPTGSHGRGRPPPKPMTSYKPGADRGVCSWHLRDRRRGNKGTIGVERPPSQAERPRYNSAVSPVTTPVGLPVLVVQPGEAQGKDNHHHDSERGNMLVLAVRGCPEPPFDGSRVVN